MLDALKQFQRQFMAPSDARVAGEAVRFLYRNFSPIVFGLLILPSLVIWVLWDQVNPTHLIFWGLCSYALLFVRIMQILSYYRTDPPNSEAHKWGNYIALTSFLSGSLWGIAAIVFFVPDSTAHQVFIFTVIVTLIAGSVMVTSYWLPSFLGFMLPCVSGLIISTSLRGTPEWFILTILFCIFTAVLLQVGFISYKNFVNASRLHFENVGLIEMLREQKTKAEHANRAKTQFLASASHDLRQPVHALALFADALKYEVTTPKGQSIMNSLTKSVESIDELLSSLLDISKLDAGVVKVNAAEIRLKPILGKIRNEFSSQANNLNIDFSVRDTNLAVNSDPVLLTNIIRNLVSNAFRYTEKGKILVAARKLDKEVSIEVWDTGIGIPEQEQEKIFSEFYQLNNPERDRGKGLGLGLAICQRLCQLLKHQLSLRSTPGKGTVFKIRVPLVSIRFDETTVRLFPSALTSQNQAILVVDDEKEILHAMRVVLESWRYNVLTASNGEEALKIVESDSVYKPDLIICDYRLRNDETGITVIDRVQSAMQKKIPAIIMTGDIAPERIREAEASGHALVHKPVKPAGLYTTLQNLLAAEV